MIFPLQAKCKGPLETLLLYQGGAAALVHAAGAQGRSGHSLQESLMSILILGR